jgi:hypothetical protein
MVKNRVYVVVINIYITYVIDSAVFLMTLFCTTKTVLLVNGRAAGAHFLKIFGHIRINHIRVFKNTI